MSNPNRRVWGFTLIELMVTIAVVLTFAILAVPSFQSLRQRSALRGAGDQVLSFWNQARLEAAKRNLNVKVGVAQSNSGASFCLGAATTASTTATTVCDCFTANACNVAQYPGTDVAGSPAAWGNVKLTGVTLGSSNWPTVATIKPVLIEPRHTALVDSSTKGIVTLKGPTLGNKLYQLRLNVDQFGRGVLCEPTSAADKLSDYHAKRC